jgi:hypothetical protein
MMMHASAAAASGLLLLTAFSGPALATEQQLSCKGQVIGPTGEQTPPIDMNLKLDDSGKPTIDGGGKKTDVRVTSDNPIQLKFQTKDYVGEFFHYTGALFLIYKSGHVAGLNCSRG